MSTIGKREDYKGSDSMEEKVVMMLSQPRSRQSCKTRK